MSAETTPVVDCTKFGDETRAPLCAHCVDERIDDAREAFVVDCNGCAQPAELCESCAADGLHDRLMEWAGRRKALGLLSAECFAEFELCAEDLRVGDA